MFVYRAIETVKINGELPTDTQTFGEFWNNIVKLVSENGSVKMTKFEESIFQEISDKVNIFEAEKRPDYAHKNWGDYLEDVVIPMVLLQRYNKDPKKFKKEFIESLSNSNCREAVEQRIDNTFMYLLGLRRGWDDGYSRGSMFADTELFADIVQYNSQRKQPGVMNEISDAVWGQVDTTINNILNDLVAERLAMNVDQLQIM